MELKRGCPLCGSTNFKADLKNVYILEKGKYDDKTGQVTRVRIGTANNFKSETVHMDAYQCTKCNYLLFFNHADRTKSAQ